MALKTKSSEPPPLPATNERFEEYIKTVRPGIDGRLNAFIQANPRSNEFYEYMVKRHPDRAVRALMLDKMFKHEAQMKVVQREAPQAKEWLDQQEPSLKEWIKQKLQDVNPFYREKRELNLIKSVKNKIDFTPPNKIGQGMSI